jgi:serine protease Do
MIMMQDLYARYRGGCMMLMRQEGGTALFMGTAFLIHPKGYLLTAAHLLHDFRENLYVAPRDYGKAFAPMTSSTVVPLPCEVRQIDIDHDIALLYLPEANEVSMTGHVMGVPEAVSPGSAIACLGYPFGFYHVYNFVINQGIVSAKMRSRNDTHLLLIDTPMLDGMRGGPLISAGDGRVIGVLSGRFSPEEAMGLPHDETTAYRRIYAYAISIEYATPLMEAEGLEIV